MKKTSIEKILCISALCSTLVTQACSTEEKIKLNDKVYRIHEYNSNTYFETHKGELVFQRFIDYQSDGILDSVQLLIPSPKHGTVVKAEIPLTDNLIETYSKLYLKLNEVEQ